MDRQCGNTGILQAFGQLHDNLAVIIPTQARLDRHGEFDRLDHAPRNLDHLVGLAHHPAPRAAPRNLIDRTTEIDVYQVWMGFFRPDGGFHQGIGQMTVDLDADRPFRIRYLHLGDGLGRITDQSVG